MEYQKINIVRQKMKHLNLEQEIGLKLIMNHEERLVTVMKLNLKLNDKIKLMRLY